MINYTAHHQSFEAQVSHELRIPLTGILGTAQFLYQTSLNPKQKQYLHVIKRAAKRVLRLENQIYLSLKTQTNIPFSTKNIIDFAHLLEHTPLTQEQKEYVKILLISADRLNFFKNHLASLNKNNPAYTQIN